MNMFASLSTGPNAREYPHSTHCTDISPMTMNVIPIVFTAFFDLASPPYKKATPGVMNKTKDDAVNIQAVSPVSIRQYMSGVPSSSVSTQHSLGLPV